MVGVADCPHAFAEIISFEKQVQMQLHWKKCVLPRVWHSDKHKTL